MKVYIAQPIQPNGIKLLEKFAIVKTRQSGQPSTRGEFLSEIKDVDAVILPWQTEVMDAAALEIAKKLKVIGRQGVGYENIDLQASTQRGVYVTYTPVHIPTIADHAIGLMLSAARKLNIADRFVRERKWNIGGEWVPLKFLGLDVHHKTIGIIGCGRIGAEIAKRAKGFEMAILYHDLVDNVEVERGMGARRVPLQTLLRDSDFIHICCNLTNDTRGLIGEKEFSRMKRTAIVVNTARGPVVDQKALYEALRNQTIAGAGLDVFEEEPISPDDPLLELDNVILVPHIGSAALETRQKMSEVVCSDVVSILNGRLPKYLLNPEVVNVRPLDSLDQSDDAA